jgi:hypothetical protein
MKHGDEALNASSLKFFKSVESLFASSLKFTLALNGFAFLVCFSPAINASSA